MTFSRGAHTDPERGACSAKHGQFCVLDARIWRLGHPREVYMGLEHLRKGDVFMGKSDSSMCAVPFSAAARTVSHLAFMGRLVATLPQKELFAQFGSSLHTDRKNHVTMAQG